ATRRQLSGTDRRRRRTDGGVCGVPSGTERSLRPSGSARRAPNAVSLSDQTIQHEPLEVRYMSVPNLVATRLEVNGDQAPFGDGPDCVGELGLEGQDQHHD